MPQLLAFDVYGTLIDTHGVVTALREFVGDKAPAFSALWREKQLEYSFRRGLMRRYQTFNVCVEQALDYCCQAFQLPLNVEDKTTLLQIYSALPAFSDAVSGLDQLAERGFRMVAFSNGTAAAVRGLLEKANVDQYFEDIISVDEVGSFKPNPDVYRHLLNRCQSEAAASWLISSNPFDVIGALGVSMSAAWVKRSGDAVFDPWEYAPTLTVASLDELADKLRP